MDQDFLKILYERFPLVLQKIILNLNVIDIGRLPEVSKYLKNFIESNEKLNECIELSKKLENQQMIMETRKQIIENGILYNGEKNISTEKITRTKEIRLELVQKLKHKNLVEKLDLYVMSFLDEAHISTQTYEFYDNNYLQPSVSKYKLLEFECNNYMRELRSKFEL